MDTQSTPRSPSPAAKSPPPVPRKPAAHSRAKSISPATSDVSTGLRSVSSPAAPGRNSLGDQPRQDAKLRLLRRPLCIICGRPSEAEAIAKALGIDHDRVNGREVEGINDGHTFFLGSFNLGESSDARTVSLPYYITSSLRQGIQSFSIHTSIVFNLLKPRYAIHAGVCAGFDNPDPEKKFKLRDVVISEAALNYEEGKWNTVNGKLVFEPDYDISRSPTGDMQSFVELESRRIPASNVGKLMPGAPHFYRYGDLISGSAVREDANDKLKQIRSTVARNAIGLDMEASAFLKLCEYTGVKSLGICKGISDRGDSEKGKDPTAYEDALKNTAYAVREWSLHSLPSIHWQPDDRLEPGGVVTTGYYDNFVRMVLDAYCQGWPVKLQANEGVTIPSEEIRGLKVVMPKDFKPEFFGEGGQISQLATTYKIREVSVGGRSYSRILHYKAGYLIDFPRTTNSLACYSDSVYQVQAFQRVLRTKPYFVAMHGQPLAQAIDWDDFMTWLLSSDDEETVKTDQPVTISAPVSDSFTQPSNTALFSAGSEKSKDPVIRVVDVTSDEGDTRQRLGDTESSAMDRHAEGHPSPSIRITRWDKESLKAPSAWSLVDDATSNSQDEYEDDDANFEPPAGPPPPSIPPGWRAIWHPGHGEYYYVNVFTKKARWQMPTHPASSSHARTSSRPKSPGSDV